jgi:hypothetical protein
MRNERDDINYYNVIIDNNEAKPLILESTKSQTNFDITGLPDRDHSLQLFRRSEVYTGKTTFLGFVLPLKAKLLPPPPRPLRRMEFYGDSITSGLGVERKKLNVENIHSEQNNYLSYAAMTARRFKAEYVCISRSGIGVYRSWYPLTMPQMFDRLMPNDESPKWDFSRYTPDIVVINLFQNDSWLIGKMIPRPSPEEIIAAYVSFVKTIRGKYPSAHIICTLGNMDATREGSPWPGYIEKAVQEMNSKYQDLKVYTCIFPYEDAAGHPLVTQQKDMADILCDFIKTKIAW